MDQVIGVLRDPDFGFPGDLSKVAEEPGPVEDEPDKYPLLAIEAAAATFAALLEYRSVNDSTFDFEEFARRWEDYERAPIVEFINQTRDARLEWLRARHVYLEP